MKILHDCRSTHVLEVIWTKNSMAAFIFKLDLRKDQSQVKVGQIKSNFHIQNFLTETRLSCPVLSQYSKNVTYLERTTMIIAKKFISNK